MGVDLGAITRKKQVTLAQLKGRRVAVDAFNTLYQFLTIIRQPDGTPLMDGQGRITSHLSGLFYRTCNLLEAGIRPCFVFDGTPSELKKKTIAQRAEAKLEAEQAMRAARQAGRTAEAAMLAQRTARLTKEMVDESKQLLSCMGVPFVQAPSEGEAQCAAMCASGVVDAAASQDYDTLLFGSPVLVRNLTIAGRRKLPGRGIYSEVFPEEIVLQESLSALGITREKLVWIGLLAGTDFNEGIRGIGPKKALKLVLKHESFEAIAGELGDKAQGFDYKPVEELFLKPGAAQVKAEQLRPGELKRSELVEFMCGQRGFSQERIESSIARAYREPQDSSQSSLKKWF